MKRNILIVIMLLLSVITKAQMIFSENFNGYVPGNLGSQNGWTPFSASSPEVQVQNTAPLTYPGYSSGGNYVSVALQSAGTGVSHYKKLTQDVLVSNPATQTIFYSFLVRVTNASATIDNGNYSVSLRRAAGTLEDQSAGRFSIVKESGTNKWKFGVSAGTGATFTTVNSTSATDVFLIVVRYDMIPNAADKAYLWVNPSLASEPSTASANAFSTSANDVYGDRLDALMVFQRNIGSRPEAQFDAFRVAVGTTSNAAFTALTPATCAAPVAQPAMLTFTNTGNSAVTGSFTASAPASDNYLVVRTNGTMPGSPVNGTTYTAGASALGGTIVSSAAATSFTATGLASSTAYTFYVYAYNATGCIDGPAYNTASPLSGQVTTTTAPLLLSDNFNAYSNGSLNNQGGWMAFMNGSDPQIQVQNTSPLSYSGYTSGGPYISVVPRTNNQAGRSSYKNFTLPVTENAAGGATQTIYYSFLVRISDAFVTTDNANYSVSLRYGPGTTEDGSVARFSISKDGSGKWIFGLAAGTIQSFYNTNSSSTTEVFRVLVRYDLVPNAADLSYLWVNPSMTGEPSISTANISSSATPAYGPNLNALMVFQRDFAGRPAAQLDAFRVASGNTSAAAYASLGTPELPYTKKLGIIGSSTSACTGPSSTDSCYVNRILNYYNTEAATPVSVENLAVGGTDPYHAMPTGYIAPANRPATNTSSNITKIVSGNPDVILINFPSNGFCDYTVAEIMNTFRIMRTAAITAGIPCYITTTQPREQASCYATAVVKAKIIEIRDSIIQQFGQYAIDFYTPVADMTDSSIVNQYNSGDGIHLNNAGHRLLFQQVLAKNIFTPVNTPLPLNFISFKGFVQGSDRILIWKTAGIAGLNDFLVERSENGSTFETIGKINPAEPATDEYSFTDRSVSRSINYYRIAAMNLDGSRSYSPVVKLQSTDYNLFPVKVYSVGKVINVVIECTDIQALNITLVNMSGQMIGHKSVQLEKGKNNVSVDAENATPGLYLIKINSKDISIVQKVMVP